MSKLQAYLCWKQRELVVSLQPSKEWVFVCDEISGVVSMDGDPVAASVDDEVMWEGPVVDTPHVIVTLNKRSIQPLLLDESVALCVYMRERRERKRERVRERERGLSTQPD